MSIESGLLCALVYVLILYIDQDLLSWQCLSRPIVVAPITGLVLGDPITGIIMGASLEAIFMGISAVGGSIPSDALSGSIIAVAYAIMVGGKDATETGLALAMTIGTIMASISSVFMALWGALAPWWEKIAVECKPNKFIALNLFVSFLATLPAAVIIFAGVAFGVNSLQAALAACPEWVITGLSAAGSMMTAVGFGILLSQIWSGDVAVFFFVGFVLAKSLGLSSLGVAIIGAGIALFYFFIEKDVIAHKSSAENDGSSIAKPANTEEEFF